MPKRSVFPIRANGQVEYIGTVITPWRPEADTLENIAYLFHDLDNQLGTKLSRVLISPKSKPKGKHFKWKP